MSCDFIVNNIKVNICENYMVISFEKEDDLCIRLEDEFYYKLFVKWLFKDLENDELYIVFKNDVMKYLVVLWVFIELMKNKMFIEFYFIFLLKCELESINKYGFNFWVCLLN